MLRLLCASLLCLVFAKQMNAEASGVHRVKIVVRSADGVRLNDGSVLYFKNYADNKDYVDRFTKLTGFVPAGYYRALVTAEHARIISDVHVAGETLKVLIRSIIDPDGAPSQSTVKVPYSLRRGTPTWVRLMGLYGGYVDISAEVVNGFCSFFSVPLGQYAMMIFDEQRYLDMIPVEKKAGSSVMLYVGQRAKSRAGRSR